MEVILLEDVSNLGLIGDLVKVAGGYGRNYLLPRELAVEASLKNKARLAHQKRLASHKQAKARAAAEALSVKLMGLVVRVARRAGEHGKIFGSVNARDISDALQEQHGHMVDRRKILLEDPIKELGTTVVQLRLQDEVFVQLKVEVGAES